MVLVSQATPPIRGLGVWLARLTYMVHVSIILILKCIILATAPEHDSRTRRERAKRAPSLLLKYLDNYESTEVQTLSTELSHACLHIVLYYR